MPWMETTNAIITIVSPVVHCQHTAVATCQAVCKIFMVTSHVGRELCIKLMIAAVTTTTMNPEKRSTCGQRNFSTSFKCFVSESTVALALSKTTDVAA